MISVVLVHYKHESYLWESIQSIINQTYQDWELLLMNDDPETDLKCYARLDNRITVVNCDKHTGQGTKVNRALQLARGEFIAMQDADDISMPYRFQVSLDFLLSNKFDFIYGDMIGLTPEGQRFYVNCQEWNEENILNHRIGGEATQFWKKSLDVPKLRDGYGKWDPWKLELFFQDVKADRLPLPLLVYRTWTSNHRKRFQMRWKRFQLKRELRQLYQRLQDDHQG